MRCSVVAASLIPLVLAASISVAEDVSDVPKPIPNTRPEIKTALEALKRRTPRLPLPESAGEGGVNNGRMRALYVPESWTGGNSNRGSRFSPRGAVGQRGNNGAATLDYVLTTECFWIVSRGNNCHYCLGHQEMKLAGAGVSDDRIAALDFRWSDFDPRTRAALSYARKMTLEPEYIDDGDIAALKSHFTNNEIIELTFIIARFNATNRWTDGMGIPQDARFGEEAATLLTPTSDEFLHTSSQATANTRKPRPPMPTPDEIAAAIAASKSRTARVDIPAADAAKLALGEAIGDRTPRAWERAMSAVPEAGKAQIIAWNTILTDDHLEPRLKAELAYITAVHNRAWYAVGTAAGRLASLGVTPEEMASVLSDSNPAHRLARKSTVDPHLITDRDIADVREQFSDAETAEVMHVICMANLFDRFSESLGLVLDAP